MKRMPRPLAAALLAALVLALSAGCAGRREPVPDNVGYHQLRESFGDRDLTPLQGRRILLDPGHGGYFRGVVGLDGLSEAEVNLGVALWLRGLLEAAGAEVHMTRTADVDFLSPADSSLTSDLEARSAICNTLKPDVFLSLHHNSNAALDRDMNETQTYYPVGREGADLDLARAIHKHLVRNLEIEPAKIMAGNFSVLRNATVPAVLGEPAMLSHPGVERKLSAAGKQRLEAEAYFLGLLEYFEGGTPYWELLTDTSKWDGQIIDIRFISDTQISADAPLLDPTSITASMSGAPMSFEVAPDGQTIFLDASQRRDPAHSRITIEGRNTAGRSARGLEFDLHVPYTLPPIQHQTYQLDGFGSVLLTWWSRPGYEGEILLGSSNPALGFGSHSIGRVEWGAGCVLRDSLDFPPLAELVLDCPSWITTQLGNPAGFYQRHTFDPPIRWMAMHDPWGSQAMMDGHWRLRAHPGTTDWEAHIARGWMPRNRPAFPLVEDHPAWLEIRGARPILIDATHRTPWQAPCDSPQDTIVWQPLVPEMVGKTIVIDPHGGAADADGTAPMGTPGRELNLRIAERLAHLLRGAGAEAVLTRDDPGYVPKEAKILQANEADADLFITLKRATPGGSPWRVAHHYGSRGGSAWAAYLKETLGHLSAPDTVAVEESYAYLLRHTACPAVEVSLPMPADLDAEELWRAPAYQQAVASELLSATAAWFQGDDLLRSLVDPRTFMVERQIPHRPVVLDGVDWIRVDGNWLWLPPRDDSVPAARLPLPGVEHTFEVRRGDAWELYVSGYGEGDEVWVNPFWTSERQPTNPFATTETADEPSAP